MIQECNVYSFLISQPLNKYNTKTRHTYICNLYNKSLTLIQPTKPSVYKKTNVYQNRFQQQEFFLKFLITAKFISSGIYKSGSAKTQMLQMQILG